MIGFRLDASPAKLASSHQKAPSGTNPGGVFVYLSEVLSASKLLSLVPTPCTAVMMATAMPATIRSPWHFALEKHQLLFTNRKEWDCHSFPKLPKYPFVLYP